MALRCPGLVFFAILVTASSRGLSSENDSGSLPYVSAVRSFADRVLEHGRDKYGPKKTPLFVDGLHVETQEPVRWKCRGETWVLSNFASQQSLVRLLDGLTGLTGEAKYRQAAEQATGYALEHLRTPSGMFYWGGHAAWDLEGEKPVGQSPKANVHELKNHQPYYELMWRVNPRAAREAMEGIWAGHILDWSLLDYNRHAEMLKPIRPRWDHPFAEDVGVPFPAKGGNLSFANVTPPLLRTGAMLAVLGDSSDAFVWTRRLLHRWQQGRDKETGLCGGQLSYRKDDRAKAVLGRVHPEINEANIVASYHQTSRYHNIPLTQMQAAETLLAAGSRYEEPAREWIRWASDDLKVYAARSYDPQTGRFLARMTDGTAIQWQKSGTDYYTPESFAPREPDGTILWSYAMAYRLTGDPDHWRMARELARRLDLGDLGSADGSQRAPRLDSPCRDWRAIYAMIELHRTTGDRAMLRLGSRIADNLLAMQTGTGLFPRPGRVYASTGDEVPLAILHLAAALDGKSSALPQATFDYRFFHCEYHGELEEHQKKRADARTYDHLVFYGEM